MTYFVFVEDVNATEFEQNRIRVRDDLEDDAETKFSVVKIVWTMADKFSAGERRGHNYVVISPYGNEFVCFADGKKRYKKLAKIKAEEIVIAVIKDETEKKETAINEAIACWDNGFPVGDDKYISEHLVKKSDKIYYLYIKGGEKTLYSKFDDGIEVRIITKDEAKEWAISRGLIDSLGTFFADVA